MSWGLLNPKSRSLLCSFLSCFLLFLGERSCQETGPKVLICGQIIEKDTSTYCQIGKLEGDIADIPFLSKLMQCNPSSKQLTLLTQGRENDRKLNFLTNPPWQNW